MITVRFKIYFPTSFCMDFLNLNIVIDENGITTNNHRLPLHLDQQTTESPLQPPQATENGYDNLNPAADPAAAGGTTTIGATIGPPLPRDIFEVISRHKLVIPFIVLLLMKLLINSVSELVIFGVSMYLLSRIKSGIEIQLALKRRCDVSMLAVLLAAAVLSISYVFVVMNISGGYKVWNRIFFFFSDIAATDSEKNSSVDAANVFTIVWLVAMTDIVVMFIVSAIKLILFIVFKYVPPSSLTMCHQSYSRNLSDYSTVPNSVDIESGLSAIALNRQEPSSNNNRNNDYDHNHNHDSVELLPSAVTINESHIYDNINTDSDVINNGSNNSHSSNMNAADSVRRRERSRDNSNSNQLGRIDLTDASPATGTTALHGASHFSMNSSDIGTHEESLSYVFHLRLFASIDAVMIVYRSMLPFSVWLSFFSVGTAGGLFFAMYFFIKLINIWSKVSKMIIVLLIFITGKLEYGQYATAAEIRGAPDCPICFDAPQRCVKLPCEHCFCEVCILEWLDKEKTCPVCRAAVISQSPAIDDIKEQASKLFPILI